MAAKNKSKELKLSRMFNAPVDAVWDAWTDPEQAAQWWGPRGFTITTHGKDLREGGYWHYTMHGPDGTDYPNKTKYLEVVEQSRLVYDHGGNDDRPPLFRVTVQLTDLGERTRMDMTMALATPEIAEETRLFIKKAGGDATWDRLAEYLEKSSTGREKFVINRSFGVPTDLMFEMWTDPRHIARWLPPAGFEMQYLRADVRPGGTSFYRMYNDKGDKGMIMYGRAHYLEISRPDRLVYTQQFCDEHENISRHPLAPVWPETMLTHVHFTPESPDSTRVTVIWEPHGDVTPAELDCFMAARGGMTQGWTGSFDKLEEYLNGD